MSFLTIPYISKFGNLFFGVGSGRALNLGTQNTGFGFQALLALTNGSSNCALGRNALTGVTSGGSNIGIGDQAAPFFNTGNSNSVVGSSSGTFLTGSDSNNSIFGAGANARGSDNSFFGSGAGSQMVSGQKNSIFGRFNGNQGGLNITALSNYIVLSDGDGNPRFWINDTGAVNIPGGFALTGGTANGVLYLNGSKVVTSGSGLVFDPSGNLGIGTSSPGVKLDVNGSGRFNGTMTASYASGFDNTYISQNGATGNGCIMATLNFAQTVYQPITYDASYYVWRPNGTEGVRLDSSGNLGIGTSSPAAKLEVTGNIQQTWATSMDRFIGAKFSTTYELGFHLLEAGRETRIVTKAADSTDKVTIYTGTTPTERMRVDSSGNVVAGGSVALATTATNGFLYVPTCAGTPTGTPNAITGMAPIVVNTTNNKLYFYSGGAWRDAGP